MAIQLKQPFEKSAADILAIGMLDASATDPTAFTAAGKGLTTARVGKLSEFVVTAIDVWTGKQRSSGGDGVMVTLAQSGAADKGAAASRGGGGAAATAESGKRKRGGSTSSGKGSEEQDWRLQLQLHYHLP